jgi:enoyl-CoA hydratase/carnithine racemase
MAIVGIEDSGAVRTITLNRPERLNALGREMREALEAAVADAATSPARVVVLQGAGRVFSAGADLKDPDALGAGASWVERRRAAGAWGRLLDAIEALPQVTVAGLHGHVIGGAALLAVACDLRVAAPDLALSIPELAIGIPLTWGGIPRLAREIGIARTRELVLTGRTVGADDALAWGLVHRVGDRDAETRTLVDELLAMPAGPAAVTKDAMRAYGRTIVSHEAAWADPDLLDAARRDPEGAEAANTYLERLRRDRS